MYHYTYILDGRIPVPEPDMEKFGRWMWCDAAITYRCVNRTNVKKDIVSTVFIGSNHNFEEGPPILFETKVFGGALHDETKRYATWKEAELGHINMVKRVSRGKINA